MAWIHLLLAGVLEIVWAAGLKFSHGFSRPIPSTITVVAMIASFWLLALALRTLPLGTAYAIWTGIGSAGAFLVGIWLFDEPVNALRIASVVLIVAGIVGLKLSASTG